jgi:Family of unknown function (DUF6152)
VKSKIVIVLSMSLGALIVAVPIFAHHSSAAFETGKNLTIKGTVTEWFWANPHCLLKLDVKTDSGEMIHWVAETQAPANMIDAGWRKNSFKAGEEVTVIVRPAKSGKPLGSIVRVEFADGKSLAIGGTEAVGNEFHLSGAPAK